MAKEFDAELIIESTLGGKDVNFYDAKCEPFRLYGIWHDGEKYYRVPKNVAQGVSVGIANTYGSTSGGRVRFRTNSPYVAVKVVYASVAHNDVTPLSATAALTMEADGKFVGIFRTPDDFREGDLCRVIDMRSAGDHLVTIYMPTHSEISELYIGVAPDARISRAEDYRYEKPVLFYGSSVTHGTGASRSSGAYPTQISKMLNTNFINLGFGGLAKGEAAMAEYIAGLEMSVFVMDYDYNAPNPEHLRKTHEPFYKIIRAKQPDLPIIMITRPSTFRTGAEETAEAYAVIRATYDNAKASGDENVYFINGLEFFPEDDSEYLVEGTHPNNLGYSLMANRIVKELQPILEKNQ